MTHKLSMLTKRSVLEDGTPIFEVQTPFVGGHAQYMVKDAALFSRRVTAGYQATPWEHDAGMMSVIIGLNHLFARMGFNSPGEDVVIKVPNWPPRER